MTVLYISIFCELCQVEKTFSDCPPMQKIVKISNYISTKNRFMKESDGQTFLSC